MRLPDAPLRYDRSDQDEFRRILERALTQPADVGGGGGGGSGSLTVLLSGAPFATLIGTIDFASGDFDATETPTGELNLSLDATVSRTGHSHAFTDISGVATRAQLPAAIAYEDENNTFTLAQVFNIGVQIGSLPPNGVPAGFSTGFAGRNDWRAYDSTAAADAKITDLLSFNGAGGANSFSIALTRSDAGVLGHQGIQLFRSANTWTEMRLLASGGFVNVGGAPSGSGAAEIFRVGGSVNLGASGYVAIGGTGVGYWQIESTPRHEWSLGGTTRMHLTTTALNPVAASGLALGTVALPWGSAWTGNLTLIPAASRIIPGATSLSLRNNADSADNLLLTDAGAATFRNAVITSGTNGGFQIQPRDGSGQTWQFYNQTGDDLRFYDGTVDRIILTSAALSPAAAGGQTLGTVALPWGDLFLGTLGRFDSTDAPANGEVLVYNATAAKWQSQGIQFTFGPGDFRATLLTDSTALAYVLLDPGTAGAAAAPNTPTTPIVSQDHLAHTLEIRDYVKTANFRYFEWEYCTGAGCVGWGALAFTTSTKVVHSRLVSGTVYRYRVRAVGRDGDLTAFATTGDNTATANSETHAFGAIIAGEIAVANLSAISADIGLITAGRLQNSGATAGINLTGAVPGTWTQYIDLANAGIVKVHGNLELTTAGGEYLRMIDTANVAHGMTTIAPTDVFGTVSGFTSVTGGLELIGLTDGANYSALFLKGYGQDGAAPQITLIGGKRSGTGTQALGDSEVIARFGNNDATPNTQGASVLGDGSIVVRHTVASAITGPHAGGTIVARTDDVTHSGNTTETQLYGESIRAGLVNVDGRGVRVRGRVVINASASGTTTLRLKLGAQTFWNVAMTTGAQDLVFDVALFRTGAATSEDRSPLFIQQFGGAAATNVNEFTGLAVTWANANTLEFTAQMGAAGSGSITIRNWHVEYIG